MERYNLRSILAHILRERQALFLICRVLAPSFAVVFSIFPDKLSEPGLVKMEESACVKYVYTLPLGKWLRSRFSLCNNFVPIRFFLERNSGPRHNKRLAR